jgi:hypothetical protein
MTDLSADLAGGLDPAEGFRVLVAAQRRLGRVFAAVRGGIRESATLDIREREWTPSRVHRSLRATCCARELQRTRLRDVEESGDRKFAVAVERSDLDGGAERDRIRSCALRVVDFGSSWSVTTQPVPPAMATTALPAATRLTFRTSLSRYPRDCLRAIRRGHR